MVALNFKKEFAGAVESRIKRQALQSAEGKIFTERLGR